MATLITPGLVIEVAEAVEDSVITAKELEGIIGVVTPIFIGIMLATFVGMLMRTITKETGIKTKEIAGVPIPMYG